GEQVLQVRDVVQASARPDHVVGVRGQAGEVQVRLDEGDVAGVADTPAHPADHTRAQLVDVELLAPAGAKPGRLVAALVAAERGRTAKRPAANQGREPRAAGAAR